MHVRGHSERRADPKHRLRELVGGAISESALDRALDELWAKLRITRVDYKPDEGVFWDELFRWSPEAVRSGTQVSVVESLTALVSKYLDCVVAAAAEEVEQFFSHLIGRARVREAIRALQATPRVGLRAYWRAGHAARFLAAGPVGKRVPPEPKFEALRLDLECLWFIGVPAAHAAPERPKLRRHRKRLHRGTSARNERVAQIDHCD